MAHKKRIVHLIGSLERGGAEMSLLRMLPLLKGIESWFVTIGPEGSLAERFRKAGIVVLAANQKNFWDIPSYIRLKRIMSEIRPNLIITHLLYPDLVGRLFLQWFYPGRVIASLATTYNFPRYWPARLIERLTKWLCSGYIANSEIVKKTYIEKFGVLAEKITVLPTGMDTAMFSNLTPNEKLREDLGLTSETIVAICVANLHINKGHRYLLEAFENIYEKHPRVRLLVVGDGEERDALERQIEQYRSKSAVHFLGRRSDVPDLLRLSHFFVLPTFFEGMCNAIMEAMAAGLPVITTDIPENRELVTPEKNGLLCPIRDSQCFAQAMKRLVKDRSFREELGQDASQTMKEKFSLLSTAQKWGNYYQQRSSRS